VEPLVADAAGCFGGAAFGSAVDLDCGNQACINGSCGSLVCGAGKCILPT